MLQMIQTEEENEKWEMRIAEEEDEEEQKSHRLVYDFYCKLSQNLWRPGHTEDISLYLVLNEILVGEVSQHSLSFQGEVNKNTGSHDFNDILGKMQ